MQRHIDERKCDFCQKVVQQSAMQFGGSPFSGWFRVEKTDGSTKIPRPDVGPWDFCCVNCCMNFLSGKSIPEIITRPRGDGCIDDRVPIDSEDV